ncbi:hypothetical protein U8C33_24275 [Sinorhizobium meliloti]|uniref:hypothetical protein n=1 Tax=Rhizobium meliloti TaxID=382 RepID=UPI000FD3AD63|nr:hypothetical protein [Sinorhizobium meliloti]RVI11992.1 hypothetical protein CN206_12655 [Sinorhizobium meliloti]RVI25792.1 hypothetical protein CN207_19515 [Sinorhizobium meliloti]RVO93808.1 hypothetical protein CN109_36765 [Sinorhizobium meliloti]WQP22067.1 hypothetical protein U8C33_24275 [Sinorhizobium meliloti]
MTKLTGKRADLVIVDDIGEFVPSPELAILRQQGDGSPCNPRHQDYSVRFKGCIVAQGRRVLMENIFNRISVGSLEVRRD